MAESKINEKAKEINLKANSKKEFFLIHGYTGSPTDFNGLGKYLHKKFNANVKILRLKGHGTKIEDLDKLEFEDFANQVEKELKKDIKKGMSVVIGGVSFGAQLALYLAGRYPVKGVFHVSIPHNFKFPFNIPFFGLLGFFKKRWRKRIGIEEAKLREGCFHYKEMHANALKIAKIARKKVETNLHKINAPLLSIHSKKEPIGDYLSIEHIERRVKSDIKESYIFEKPNHNLFYSDDRDEIIKIIGDFFEKHAVFEPEASEKVSAIVPSYNEEERIGNVLNILTKTRIIDEVIVIDDSSSDNTSSVVSRFKNVKYIRNKENMGKGYSMDVGVKNAKHNIIFFCDADIINLKPGIIEDSIRPVINKEVDMFIAMRGNLMQKSVKLFGLNSGERALRKKIWEKLPDFYKYRYRIEAGLNYYVSKYGRGFGYRIFTHSQPIKEKKYGFLKGSFLRWWMNFDVLYAYISCLFMGHLLKKKPN